MNFFTRYAILSSRSAGQLERWDARERVERLEMSPGKPDRSSFPGWMRHTGVGLELAGAVAGFTLLGYWVDRHYATGPWGVVGGVAFGFAGGLYNLVKQSLQAVREAKAEDAARSGAPGPEDRQDGD